MYGKTLFALLALAACAPSSAVEAETAAVASSIGTAAVQRPDMRKICEGKTEWSDPGPPVHIFGNTYHVGTCTITVLLVTSPQGHILLDASPSQSAPSVIANIRSLGFDPKDVKWILSSHEHWDHSGGLAALKRLTGAQLAANEAEVDALEAGTAHPDDPQASWLEPAEPVKVDKIMRDGDVLSLGPLSLTMYATPAHSPGSTSWSWSSCEGQTCHSIAYADSNSTPAPDEFHFTDHPANVANFRAALEKIAALPCDILLTPHPGQSRMYERYAGEVPLVDPQACRRYSDFGDRRMDARLAEEAAATQ